MGIALEHVHALCTARWVPPRVLVAEDDPQLRELLRIALRRLDVEVELAADGLEALEMLERREYALLLLDLMMPRLSGYDIVPQLREMQKRPIVIVVTAMTTKRYLDLDPTVVSAIVHKPFDLDLVAGVVEGIVWHFTEPARSSAPMSGELRDAR